MVGTALASIILGAIAAANAIAGGAIGASKAAKAKLAAQTEEAKNDSWFNRERYSSALEKNRDVMSSVSESLGTAGQEQAGIANVMGTSPEIAAAARNSANRQYAGTANKIMSEESAGREKMEDAYETRNSDIQEQKRNADAAQAQNLANAATGIASAAGQLAGTIAATNGGEAPTVTTKELTGK